MKEVIVELKITMVVKLKEDLTEENHKPLLERIENDIDVHVPNGDDEFQGEDDANHGFHIKVKEIKSSIVVKEIKSSIVDGTHSN